MAESLHQLILTACQRCGSVLRIHDATSMLDLGWVFHMIYGWRCPSCYALVDQAEPRRRPGRPSRFN